VTTGFLNPTGCIRELHSSAVWQAAMVGDPHTPSGLDFAGAQIPCQPAARGYLSVGDPGSRGAYLIRLYPVDTQTDEVFLIRQQGVGGVGEALSVKEIPATTYAVSSHVYDRDRP
jgi:hypothetical protein